MNKPPLLILDCNYLCHRAFYAMGDLKFHEDPTGALFGFFQDIEQLQERFGTRDITFCFDYGKNKRKKINPLYKANRNTKPDPEGNRKKRQSQLDLLRTEYLPALGFKNVFFQDGYEADDIMAIMAMDHSVARDHDLTQRKILVTADQDMYQLLNTRVAMWIPTKKKLYTAKTFKKEYHIFPEFWAEVKAIAGCSSDNVKGIKGVGEKTAIKLIKKTLPETHKAWEAFEEGKAATRNNLKLVRLPLYGVKLVKMQKDNVTRKKWVRLMKQLGMSSLIRRIPLSARS